MTTDAPTTCPVCGAAVRIESQYLDAIGITVRVFGCGATQGLSAAGRPFPGIICPRTVDVIAQLRADNVRLGDRNVLLAIAMQAAIEGLEKSLRAWAVLPLDTLPKVTLLELAPIRAAYDELVDALEGAAPAAEAPANETCPGQSEGVSAAEHVDERSLLSP